MTRLILASTSPVRRLLLYQSGLVIEAVPPETDEIALKASLPSADPATMAALLADAKAVSVANRHSGALVIGADQVLNLDGRILDKPATMDDARHQLERLRSREHWLETALSCAREGSIVWRHLGRAKLVMRDFSDEFLSNYLEETGADALSSVGAYKLEGRGIQLFQEIEGDYFTILGLPLLPLLAFLRSNGAIAS